MTDRNTFFGAFTLERVFNASPARVFAAYADRDTKQRWMGCDHVASPVIERLEMRPGGVEISRGPGDDGEHLFEGIYHDVVDDRRFVLSFVMHVGGVKLSASLATVELVPEGAGTRLIFNEQGVYFGADGWAEREEGTAVGMDTLASWLAEQDGQTA